MAAYTIRLESATFGRGTAARLLTTRRLSPPPISSRSSAPRPPSGAAGLGEDRPAAPAEVAVISDRLWRRESLTPRWWGGRSY
ncbi:MAG: hypothetical protein R2882_12345 [Gemmatimonadales bacterium]